VKLSTRITLSTRTTFWITAFALLLAGCGTDSAEAEGKGKLKNKGKGGAVPVLTAVAVLKDVPIEIQVVGNVEPYSTVSIRAQVSGQLTNVALRDGDYVHKGDQLFSIDARQIEGQLQQSEANLARSSAQLTQAEANLARDTAQANNAKNIADRAEQLVKDGIFSKEQGQQSRANADALVQSLAADRAAIDSARAQMAADQAAINNIRLQRSYTTIFAPIDGRTGNVTQKQGNIVTANNTELAQIHQVEPIYVAFAVPEGRLTDVKRYYDLAGRLPVAAQLQDAQGDTGAMERGSLTFIDNAVDMSTGTIRLKGTFPNTGHTLWPGQFVNVTLQLTTRHNAVVVPSQAVQTGQDGNFIYVVGDEGKVEFRPVKVGPRTGTDLVIDEGIRSGEVVVTDGQLRLQPGSTVQVSNSGRNQEPLETGGGVSPDRSNGLPKGKGKGKSPVDGI
jgi:multidrug efflux system membrane fusion protein